MFSSASPSGSGTPVSLNQGVWESFHQHPFTRWNSTGYTPRLIVELFDTLKEDSHFTPHLKHKFLHWSRQQNLLSNQRVQEIVGRIFSKLAQIFIKEPSLVKTLIDLEGVNLSDERRLELFDVAISTNNLEYVSNHFAELQQNAKFIEKYPDSPLSDAIKSGNLEMVKFFLTSNPELINQCNSRDWVPVHLAALFGHLNILKFFFDQNPACINQPNSRNCLPIHLAAAAGHWHVLEFFFEQDPECIRRVDLRGNLIIDYISLQQEYDDRSGFKQALQLLLRFDILHSKQVGPNPIFYNRSLTPEMERLLIAYQDLYAEIFNPFLEDSPAVPLTLEKFLQIVPFIQSHISNLEDSRTHPEIYSRLNFIFFGKIVEKLIRIIGEELSTPHVNPIFSELTHALKTALKWDNFVNRDYKIGHSPIDKKIHQLIEKIKSIEPNANTEQLSDDSVATNSPSAVSSSSASSSPGRLPLPLASEPQFLTRVTHLPSSPSLNYASSSPSRLPFPLSSEPQHQLTPINSPSSPSLIFANSSSPNRLLLPPLISDRLGTIKARLLSSSSTPTSIARPKRSPRAPSKTPSEKQPRND